MSVRIFSKKAFAIGEGLKRGTDNIENFVTVPQAFQHMPDKYLKDATFLLAVASGDITVINNSFDEKQAELDSSVIKSDVGSVQTESEAFYEQLKVMSKEESFLLGDKYDVKPKNGEKLGQYKRRIMEAWKIANTDEEPSEHNEEVSE